MSVLQGEGDRVKEGYEEKPEDDPENYYLERENYLPRYIYRPELYIRSWSELSEVTQVVMNQNQRSDVSSVKTIQSSSLCIDKEGPTIQKPAIDGRRSDTIANSARTSLASEERVLGPNRVIFLGRLARFWKWVERVSHSTQESDKHG